MAHPVGGNRIEGGGNVQPGLAAGAVEEVLGLAVAVAVFVVGTDVDASLEWSHRGHEGKYELFAGE